MIPYNDDFDAYHADCIAEYVALLEIWPPAWGDEPVHEQIGKYELRIERDTAQIAWYRELAQSASKPEIRASYDASADALEALTARHKQRLAELRGEDVGQLGMFDAA